MVGVSAACRVLIDTSKCSGHGRCYTLAPDVFDMDDEGFPVIVVETVEAGSEHERLAKTAVDACPERAISLEPQA